MRELKFRAWRESDKTMYQDVTFDKIEVMWLDPDAIEDPIEAPDVRGCWVLIGDRAEHSLLPFVVLMQYTGVKDKNGREIYEGDIVRDKWNDGTSKEDSIGIVEWDDTHAEWGYRNIEIGDLFSLGHHPELGPKKFTVIGNIYENPNILLGNKQPLAPGLSTTLIPQAHVSDNT